MFYKDQILSSPADVTFERTKLTVMFFCGTENLALSCLSLIYLFADSTVHFSIQDCRDGRAFLVSRSRVPDILGTRERGNTNVIQECGTQKDRKAKLAFLCRDDGSSPPPLPHTLGEKRLPVNSGQVWPGY